MVKAVAILTISDTCFNDPSKDTAGPTLAGFIKQMFPAAYLHTIVISDERDLIERELRHFCDKEGVDLILTTGGTGLSARDVTPEATKAVIHKAVPAIPMAIALDSLGKTPMAMLSRATAGIRNKTLIINLPGSKKAVTECFEVVKPILSHAVGLLKDDLLEVSSTHDIIQHSCPHAKLSAGCVALRPRESPYPMLTMAEAFRLVDEAMAQWEGAAETLPIEEAVGRAVVEPLVAMEPMPPFPASVKDGYACLSADGAGPRRVRAALAAGDAAGLAGDTAGDTAGGAGDTAGGALAPGECVRINTGAALPLGADCVVQVEDTKLLSASEDGRTEFEVEIVVPPRPQQDVRPVGCDIPPGALLAQRGTVLDAALVGMLAGAGHQLVTVKARPLVSLLSTGNELQEPSERALRPAHIRDSNRTMLRVLLRQHGFESIDCGIARDEMDELTAAIATAFSRADVLVCTGGVSMGERDLLKPVLLSNFGATLHFGRVRMKPGKPSTFATCQFQGRTKFVFALPGNPVSAYVCCHLFVLRALRQCAGLRAPWAEMRVRLAHCAPLDARPEYARAALSFPETDDLPVATVLGNQASSRLLSACGASALLQLPGATAGADSLPAGAPVTAYLITRPN